MDAIINNINKINNNLFIIKLKKNPDLDAFIKTYIYFGDAVDNWSIILSKLITRVPTYKERYPLINNLYDENGNGNLNESHVLTFKKLMLKLININNKKSYEEYLLCCPKNEVKHFNSMLQCIVDDEHWLYCFAVLGMIEYIYITISKEIHYYVKNFIKSDSLSSVQEHNDSKLEIDHYSLHEIIDDKHSKDFFDVLKEHYSHNKELIDKGLQKGYDIFDNLYYELALNIDN